MKIDETYSYECCKVIVDIIAYLHSIMSLFSRVPQVKFSCGLVNINYNSYSNHFGFS